MCGDIYNGQLMMILTNDRTYNFSISLAPDKTATHAVSFQTINEACQQQTNIIANTLHLMQHTCIHTLQTVNHCLIQCIQVILQCMWHAGITVLCKILIYMFFAIIFTHALPSYAAASCSHVYTFASCHLFQSTVHGIHCSQVLQ